jgi:hypothetical protein
MQGTRHGDVERGRSRNIAELIATNSVSLRQAVDLVHTVLDATAIEERSIVPKVEPVRVNDPVQQVFNLYQLAAEGKGELLQQLRALGFSDRHLFPDLAVGYFSG